MRKINFLAVWLCLCFVHVGQGQMSFDVRVPRVADILNRVSNTTFGEWE